MLNISNSTGGATIKRIKTYESNKIYSHKELLTQIKPFLYYLGSIDMDCEGDKYHCETTLTVELRLKYKNIMLWVVEVGTDVKFKIFLSCGLFHPSEIKKPFKIRVYSHKKYSLLDPSVYDQCVVCPFCETNILMRDNF